MRCVQEPHFSSAGGSDGSQDGLADSHATAGFAEGHGAVRPAVPFDDDAENEMIAPVEDGKADGEDGADHGDAGGIQIR